MSFKKNKAAIDVWRRQARQHINDHKLDSGFEIIMYLGAERGKIKQSDIESAALIITSYGYFLKNK